MRNRIILTLALATTISSGIVAQVTIGSGSKPIAGSLLDIKEFESTADGVTATKGLLLPRVTINDLSVLQIAPESQKNEHIGTIVYAIPKSSGRSTYGTEDRHPCASIPRISTKTARTNFGSYATEEASGVIVWTGAAWEPLFSSVENGDGGDDDNENDDEFTLPTWVDSNVKVTNSDHNGNTYTYRYFGNKDHEKITLEEFKASGGVAEDYQNFGYWMTENLRSTSFAPKSDHPGVKLSLVKTTGGSTTSLVYGYPRVNPENDIKIDTDYKQYPTVGLLYSAGAITGVINDKITATPNMQGICPDGWFLPSQSDWNGLIAYLSTPEQVALYTNYATETPIVDQEVSRTLATACRSFIVANAVEASRSKDAADGALALIAVAWGNVKSGEISRPTIFEYPETPDNGSVAGIGFRAGSASKDSNKVYYSFKSNTSKMVDQMISVRCRTNKNPKL